MLSLRIQPGELSNSPCVLLDALISFNPSIMEVEIPGKEWEAFKYACVSAEGIHRVVFN